MKSFFFPCVSTFSTLAALGTLSAITLSLPSTARAQEVCVKTTAGDVVCGTPVPKSSSRQHSQSNEREADGLTFLLKGCRRSGSTVKCDFIVTSKRTTNFGMMAWYNAIIDSEGRSYAGSLIDVGGKSANNTGATIEPGINYALVLTFDNIPEQVITASILKLANGIQYRNVSLSN